MIHIIDDYIVETDGLNYSLKIDKHKEDKKGEPVYEIVGYYSTLRGAVEGCYKHKANKCMGERDYTLYGAISELKNIELQLEATMRVIPQI